MIILISRKTRRTSSDDWEACREMENVVSLIVGKILKSMPLSGQQIDACLGTFIVPYLF